MSAPSEPLRLAADFPAADEADWLALVAAVLHRGGHADAADPVEALTTTTYDGIRIRPLYTSSAADPGRPGEPPYSRGATPDGATVAGWDVRVRHGDPDVSRLHRAMLADLATGATSLWLTLGDAALPVSDLGAALDGVHLDIAPVALDAGAQTEAAATAFLGLVESQAAPADRIDGTLGADPIGLRARTGGEADLSLLGRLATLAAPCPGLAVATVDGTVYHEAGASDAD
jgi:methylmalonyl-CoA mutase